MTRYNEELLDSLSAAFMSLRTEAECRAFLEDICSISELISLGQRLEVAKLLSQKMSYAHIIQETGASSATISRVSRCFEYGPGGYRTVIERLSEEEDQHD